MVALAGATGSGKSSTFNALTGLDLAAIGVRRPTTSWTMSCTWGRGEPQVVDPAGGLAQPLRRVVVDAVGNADDAPERRRVAARRIDDLRFAATPTPLFEEGTA